jgi:very-short-patch-repair endonuclease
MLWGMPRGGALGAKFRRQYPVGDFILDFYCETAELAVEIDGPTHEGRREYDRWRDGVLGAQGIRVLHFGPDCVEDDAARIADTIRTALS